MTDNPAVSMNNITKRFNSIPALREVSLDVFYNELLVVLGPTGAGKTTLLRTIAGLESPDQGRIRIHGRDVTNVSPAERDVALVFQNFSLYPDWTVRENMAFPLKAPGRNHTAQEIQDRIAWAADILKITPLLERGSTKLSGGEMQRVAIGRAIVRRPGLFLLDEPLTNLDAKLREALRLELVTLRRDLGTPMVFVTHDQIEAMSMGDRIVVLHEGRILQVGSPQDVYGGPATPAVARQLGTPPINLMSAAAQDGSWTAADGTTIIPSTGAADRAILGIRPEDIAPTGGKQPGRVTMIEHMGAIVILVVEWAGQEVHLIVPKECNVKAGDTVFPAIDAGKVLVWAD